jgi:hypothetical protein
MNENDKRSEVGRTDPSARESPHDGDDIVECHCPCHHHGGMMHIIECCEGECSSCGKWFERGLSAHKSICDNGISQRLTRYYSIPQ